jgi:FkbM family methyltransferase
MNPKPTTKRLVTLWKRKQRARRLGFHFGRAAGFVPPSEIQLGTKRLHLSLPDDGGTRTAFIDVLLDDCYRLREIPDDVQKIVDIGCHVGLFSIAARKRWPQAVIHAYEPNAALKSHWEHHAGQAGFSIYPEAVGIDAGSVALVPNPDSVQVRTVQNGNGTIHQVAFREVLARMGGNVDLVKLDCEGAEWPILQDKTCWENVRFVTMEFHLWAGYTLDELKACISKIGFRVGYLEVTGADFGVLVANR